MCAEMSCLLSVFVFGQRLLSLLFIMLYVRVTRDFETPLLLGDNEMVSLYHRWVDRYLNANHECCNIINFGAL